MEALNTDGLPRYQQLSAVLAREIGEGRHPVGSLLPPEPELCKRFGVSRHTLREAVRKLCEQGRVARHQGIGTRVLAAAAQPRRYVASLGSLQDLMQYTQRTRMRLLSHRDVVADAALARQLRCDEGDHWVVAETCRFAVDAAAGEPPLVHMHIFVRPQAAGLVAELDGGESWVFGLVEKHGGDRIVEAQQVVGAMAMPAASARLLGVKPRSPGLHVRRYYFARDKRLLSVSLNLYPAERFELATEWRLAADA
jgi:GntR family transcriptional regulator